MFLSDLVVDRQLDVQLTQAESESKNEKELTYELGIRVQNHRGTNLVAVLSHFFLFRS